MNAARLVSDVEIKQVVELLKTACIIIGIAIVCRYMADAETDEERMALAQTLLRIVGLESEANSHLGNRYRSQYGFEDDEDDGWPHRPGYAFNR